MRAELKFADEFLVAADQLALLQRVRSQHPRQTPRHWASLTPFPWLENLELAEVEEFFQEQMLWLLDAARQRSMLAYDRNLRGWKSKSVYTY